MCVSHSLTPMELQIAIGFANGDVSMVAFGKRIKVAIPIELANRGKQTIRLAVLVRAERSHASCGACRSLGGRDHHKNAQKLMRAEFRDDA